MAWPYLILALQILVIGLLLLAAVIFWATRLTIQPPRMTRAKAIARLKRLSPGDLGLEFQTLHFEVHDDFSHKNINLTGWWIDAEHPGPRCVLILHGFSDSKVGGIAWAPMWRRLGFNILAIDLRAHGESDGRYCTAGWYERHDVTQVIDEIRRRRPDQTQSLILFGVSLGAAIAAATACLRTDIRAVIMDCPYADFHTAAATHARMWGMPSGWLARLVMWLAQKITRADYKGVAPVNLIPEIPCPVMVIRAEQDFLVDPEEDAAIARAVAQRAPDTGPNIYWKIQTAGHILGLAADPEGYQQRVSDFVNEAMRHGGSAGRGLPEPAHAPAGASRPSP